MTSVPSLEHSSVAQSMHRVKVATTGLAAVFVFIGLASAAFNYENKEAAVTAIGAAKPETVANMTDMALSNVSEEPLAELGVAPSAVSSNSTDAAPAR